MFMRTKTVFTSALTLCKCGKSKKTYDKIECLVKKVIKLWHAGVSYNQIWQDDIFLMMFMRRKTVLSDN
jgi:hypothetical protein